MTSGRTIAAIPNNRQIGDTGIDGRTHPVHAAPMRRGGVGIPARPGDQLDLDFTDTWYPIQVKQKDRVGRPDIDSFEAVMTGEDRTKGFFVAFDYSQAALTEIGACSRKIAMVIAALIMCEIGEGRIATKVA